METRFFAFYCAFISTEVGQHIVTHRQHGLLLLCAHHRLRTPSKGYYWRPQGQEKAAYGRWRMPGAYEQIMTNLSTLFSTQLCKTCPDATTLYNRFAGVRNAAPTPAEMAFVQSWGDELCQRLASLQKDGRLQRKTSAECMELFHQEYSASLLKRDPKLCNYMVLRAIGN